jgi:hypothetical protein
MTASFFSPADCARWLEMAAGLEPALAHRAIRPQALVTFQPDPAAFQGWRAVRLGDAEPGLARAWQDGDTVDFDFGTHVVGRLTLRWEPASAGLDAPVRLRVLLGEVPLEIAAPREPFHSNMLPCSWLQEETVTVDDLPARLTLPRRYAFRYVRIQVVGLSPRHRIRLVQLEAIAEAATFDEPPPLPEHVPPLLRQIDATAVRTLRNCLHSVFEDGPKRDRRLWLGDLRLQALANGMTLRRFNLVARCLLLFAGLCREDGIVEACLFHRPQPHRSGNVMADYALLFAPTLLDHATMSGDRTLARELWPVAARQIEAITGALGADGRLPAGHPYGWTFIDWNSSLAREGPLLGLALHCLRAATRLAGLLQDAPRAAAFTARADELQAMARTTWMRDPETFHDPFARQASVALTAWMVLGGVVTGEQARVCLERTLADADALQPAGPYLMHHLVHALFLAGARDDALLLVGRYWGGMIARGADTFWEVFTPDNELASPYENPQLNSYCHAWSCTPSWFLRTFPT